jgi:peptidoglycan/LPS O-acetylase OafA/YrhL
MTRLEPWSVLALLRFLLASIVAVGHLGGHVPLQGLWLIPYFGSFEAILGFLLISGYSVGTSYLKQPHGFMLRRVARLYPIYLSSIAITCAVDPPALSPALLGILLVNMAFLNQVLTTSSFVGPAWSLSLEFWLYGLTSWLAKRSGHFLRVATYCSFAAYCVYTCVRTLAHLPYYSGVGFGLNLLFLSFVWICGLRLARADDSRKTLQDLAFFFSAHIALAAGIQLLYRLKHHSLGDYWLPDISTYGAEATTLAVVWLAFRYVVLPNAATGGHRKSKIMHTLGDISYPLYLIHIPVFVLLDRIGSRNAWLNFALALSVALVLYQLLDSYSRRRRLTAAK